MYKSNFRYEEMNFRKILALLLSYASYSYMWYPFLERSKYLEMKGVSASITRSSSAAECKINDLKISNCGINVSRFGKKRIGVEYRRTCNLRNVTFVFHFGVDGVYSFTITKQKPEILVTEMKKELEKQRKKFLIGSHYIQVEMHATSMKHVEMLLKSEKCSFYVIRENPTPNLGRINRNVLDGVSFIVDASKSKNQDLEKNNVELEYEWSCTDSAGYCEGRNLGTDSSITVDKSFAQIGANFTFTVKVKTVHSEWQEATQFIRVNPLRPFAINCISRCGKDPNKWNPVTGVMLLAECQFSCEKYDKKKVDGLMKYMDKQEKDFPIPRLAEGPKIIMSIVANTRIKVIVYYDKNMQNVVGEQEFMSYPIPRLENCKTIPQKGTPLTKFKVECSHDKDQVKNFGVKIESNDTVVFSTTSKYLEDIEFVLPRISTAVVELRDINDVVISQKIPVQIQSLVEGNHNSSKANEHLTDILDGKEKGTVNVDTLISKGNYSEAVQVIDVVAQELSHIEVKNDEDKELTTNLRKKLVKSLSELPIESTGMAASVSGVISLIANQAKDTVSDSDMAKELSAICSEVAKKQLYLIENDVESELKKQDIIDIANNLLSCGESEIAPYYEIFNETAVEIEITTQYPIKDDLSENNIEDYPEYVADDLIENQMNNFVVAAENVMSICRDMGKSLLLAISPYNELPTYIQRNDITIGVFKSTGGKIAETIFHQHKVTVTVSPSTSDIDSLFSVQLCTYKSDPFWSASKTFRIDTNVLDLSIMDMTEEIEVKQFGTKPMNISFGVLASQPGKITGVVDFSSDSISEYPEDNFTIFTIKAKAKETFFIEFNHLDESHNMKAVVIDMERPLLHHFSRAYSVTKANKRLLIKHGTEEDKWFLLGLMPTTAGQNNSSLSLKFSVYSIRCVTWNFNTSSWINSCPIDITTTPESIHCTCSHLSILAGSFEYNDIKKHPKLIVIDFTITERGSLHICLTVCITLGIYFFIIVYSLQKRETKEDAVYFLSDVPLRNRYCYLILIKTGRRVDSGTTSDIMIQIFGTEGKSEKHVLNFPDPYLELLQRNQTDFFVLSTRNYLGKLQNIHLWFDCTGSFPNWYCREVRICDLQNRKWFLFSVNKWLRVDGNHMILLNVAVDTRQDVTNRQLGIKKMLKNILLNFGNLKNTIWSPTAHIDNANFGLPKRMTLILSILLTLMGILVLFNGKPEMMPRDTITPECCYGFKWSTINIGFYGAVITFFPHIAIMEGFKNSRLQYEDKTSEDAKILPFGVTMIIWGILIMNIIFQIHFLLIFGYWVIEPTSWQWTTSLLIALIFYIFCLDYTYHLFLISSGTLAKNMKINYEKILKNVEFQREHLYSSFGKYICRPILTPLYEVMSQAQLMSMKLYFQQKRAVIWQIQDLTMIIAFLSFLYVIIMEEKNTTYDVLAHKEVLILLRGHRNTRISLSKVNEIDEFENFMNITLIPTLQSYQWYGRYLSKSPGLTTDACNRYLGIIRLRQHRIEDTTCSLTTLMQFVNRTCRPSSYFSQLDYLNYTPAWTEAIPEFYPSRLGYVWGYQDATGESYMGVTGHYKKGGYIALLGRTEKNSFVNFEYLRRYYWLDSLTRVVFIEFPFYNVNMNLFNFATVILEKTPTGYIHKEAIVKSARIIEGSQQSTMISLICSLLFMGLVTLITVRTILRIIRTKVWYRRDIWLMVDIGIIILSITWIAMYLRRITLLEYFIKQLEEKQSNTFIDYFDMIGVESWMKILASMLICVITVRMWGLLRFAAVFRLVERTLSYSFESLMYCAVYFAIYCVGFGIMGFIIFCTKSSHFKDGFSTMKTLILMTIGLRGPNTLHMEQNEFGLAYTFIVLFYSFIYLFTTIFIAIIIVNFLRAQQFTFEEILEYNIKDYTKEKIVNMKRLTHMWIRKFRLKSGGNNIENEEMVTPKSNDIRYMNCVSVDSNRMRAMARVAKCVLLKKKKGLMVDESDHILMMRTVMNLCSTEKGEEQFFFKQATKTDGFKLIDNRRLLMIEEVIQRILEPPEKEVARLKKWQYKESLRAENFERLEILNLKLKTMLKAVNDIEFKFSTR